MRRRRDFLATIGATATALTAGCLLQRNSDSKPVRIMRMTLINFARSPADMNIELVRDGDSVFEEIYTLSVRDQDEAGAGEKQIFPEPGTEPGIYECLVEVNIRETVLESSFKSDQIGYSVSDPCIELDPIIRSPGYSREPGPSLSLSVGQINNRYDHPLCE